MKTSTTRRLDSLTGLRFIAAAAIVAVHSGFITGFGGVGRLGVVVSFFFVLSGFVLTWSWRGIRWREFYRNRFARIYPVYLCTWAIGLGVSLALHVPTSLGTVLATVTLTQSWVPAQVTYLGVNGVGWSLSCEAFFYAVFPLLIRGLVRLSAGRRRVVMLAAVLSPMLLLGVVGPSLGGPLGNWATYFLPIARLPEFVAGMVLALEIKDGWRCPRWCGIASLVVLGVAISLPSFAAIVPLLAILPFLLVIASAAGADLNGSRSLLRSRPMVALGSMSYCLYLVHVPLYGIARLVSHDVWTVPGEVLGISLVAAASLTLAASLHRFLETPAEKLLRSRARPRVGEPVQFDVVRL